MKYLIITLTLMFGTLLLPATAGAAFDPFNPNNQGVDCSVDKNKNSAVCQSKTDKDPVGGANGILLKIVNIVAFIAGAAAVILIFVGAIRFVTSGGDSNAVKGARETILYALIGLIVIVLARFLIEFVLSKV
jgi:hypothetical protein